MRFKISGRTIWGILIYIVIILRIIVGVKSGNCFEKIFWYIDYTNENRIIYSYMYIIIPQLLLLIMLGDYFTENIYKNASILTVRGSGVRKITDKYAGKLMLKGTILCISLFIIVGVRCFFSEYIKWDDLINCFLYYLFLMNLLLFVNYMSLFGSAIVGTEVGIALQIIGGIAAYRLESMGSSLGKFVPGYIFLLLKQNNVRDKVFYICFMLIQIILMNYIYKIVFKRKDWR